MSKSVCLVVVLVAAVMLALAGCKKSSGPGTGSSACAGSSAATGMAGSSAAAGAPTTGPVPGCEAADKCVTGSAAHAAALEVLNPASPCGFSSCHTPPSGKAMLVLMNATDLHTTLVGKPSCEAPPLPLVDGSGGDAALKNSWLWQKLTSAVDANGILMPQMGWPALPGTCGQVQAGSFGTRMPQTSTTLLEAPRLAAIRNWICAGAPGP